MQRQFAPSRNGKDSDIKLFAVVDIDASRMVRRNPFCKLGGKSLLTMLLQVKVVQCEKAYGLLDTLNMFSGFTLEGFLTLSEKAGQGHPTHVR